MSEKSRERPKPLPACTKLDVDMVKRDGILEHNLPRDIVRYAGEVVPDDLARAGHVESVCGKSDAHM